MGIDTTPRQPFSIGSLHSGDFTSVRTAADEGRTRLGLFERILDCVSDWVFSTERAECKQCLLDFSSSNSTALEKLEAFRRLQELAGPNYEDRFSVNLSDGKIQDLLIKVNLPEIEFFSSTTSQNCIIAEHISQWGSELDWKELAKNLDELDSPDASADEKFAFFNRLRSNVNAEYESRFHETSLFEDTHYMFGIDFEMEPIRDFVVHGENFKYHELDSIQKFKDIFIDIAKAPLTRGAAALFEIDVQRQTLYINGAEFKAIDDELKKDTVIRFDKTLKDNGFSTDEISMTKKFFIQSTMREFYRRAIDGIDIITIQGRKSEVSHSVSNTNRGFETISYMRLAPLAGQSISERANTIDAFQDICTPGITINAEKPISVNEPTYKGWPAIESKREIMPSLDTECRISMTLASPEAEPEVSIDAKFGEYIGPRNYPRGVDAPVFFNKV